jgi:hypothetical protein
MFFQRECEVGTADTFSFHLFDHISPRFAKKTWGKRLNIKNISSDPNRKQR